jgi:formylglycine-generating enzyme required for sulfatase activity
MGQVSLRDLVQQYTRGELDKEDYRKTRTDLINDVLARTHTLRTNTFPPLIKPTDEGTLDITERSQKKEQAKSSATPADMAAPAPEKTAAKGRYRRYLNPMPIVAGLILVILAIIVVVILLPERSPEQQVSVPEQPAPPATRQPPVDVIPGPAQTLIREFLQNNTWDNDSLDGFLRAWHALPETDRQSLRGTMVLNRLTNAIYGRLQEERAIAGLDTSAGATAADVSRQEGLVFFARQVGIDDERISVQPPAMPAMEQTAAQQDMLPADEPTPTAPEQPEPVAVTAAQPLAAAVDQPETNAVGVTPPREPEPDIAPAADVPAGQPAASTQVPQTTAPLSSEPAPAKPAPAVPPAQPKTAPPAAATSAAAGQKSGNCDPSLLNSRRPYCRDIIPGIGNGPTMVIIPQGRFVMGGERPDEQPGHTVVFGTPFAMSVHEITYGEYLQFCRDTNKKCPDQPWAGNDYPVVNVSWSDASAYAEWLSAKTGQRYRLPSESQWEYAARGGARTSYPFGDTIDISYAVFSERKSLSSPLPKTDRTINRNKFRLYHIVGNVREWVADTWAENYNGAPGDGSARQDGNQSIRIVRGGSYQDTAEALRSAARKSLPADTTDSYTGFRVIQEL